MAYIHSNRRKSNESTTSGHSQEHSTRSKLVPTKIYNSTKTPRRSPIKRPGIGITLAQKQALIDNLQLEITERARKLRAQYSLQAQGLRTRIEIRVNRIPTSLRRTNMGQLFAKHGEQEFAGKSKALPPLPKRSPNDHQPQSLAKRTSDDISGGKENEQEGSVKRQKGPLNAPIRANSMFPETQVLSPRSANSRAFPRSPVHQPPRMPVLARPVSPLKPKAPAPAGGAAGILTDMVDKAKSRPATRKVTAPTSATATGMGRRRRAAPQPVVTKVGRGRDGSMSERSETSTGTTIVKKAASGPKKAPGKTTMLSTIKAKAQKKGIAATSSASAGRVLRKRN